MRCRSRSTGRHLASGRGSSIMRGFGPPPAAAGKPAEEEETFAGVLRRHLLIVRIDDPRETVGAVLGRRRAGSRR